MHQVVSLLSRHRYTLARAVLVVGALVVGRELWPMIERETEVELELGPSHAEVVELRLTYLLEGEELHGVSFRFVGGAPARVKHRVSLPAGDLELHLVVQQRDGVSHVVTRRLHTPAEGRVRIRLDAAGSA